MKLSVILSTYNSPEWLEKVLTGYACQSVSGFEIVVADDGSGEETRALLDRFEDNPLFTLKHVWHADDGFQKWEIVNRAIDVASGDYLLFSDGDCIPAPTLVETHLKEAEPGRFLTGGYCRLPMATSKAITTEDIESGRAFKLYWLRAHGYGISPKWLKILVPGSPLEAVFNRLTPAAKTFNGNNSSCFRADAIAINGFDARIRYGGGDREFGYRLEHFGIRPKVVRYSTLCLHLDHPRGYKSAEVRETNLALIEESRRERRVRTTHGIMSQT